MNGLGERLNKLNIAFCMCVGQWVDWAITFHDTGRCMLTLAAYGDKLTAEGVSLVAALNDLVEQIWCDELHISPVDLLALEIGLGDYIERANAVSVRVDTRNDAVETTITMRDGTMRVWSSPNVEYGDL